MTNHPPTRQEQGEANRTTLNPLTYWVSISQKNKLLTVSSTLLVAMEFCIVYALGC